MKTSVLITAACIASASAFAPQTSNARAGSALAAKKAPVKKDAAKKSLFTTIFEMDLFAPVSTQNDYGARNGKNVSSSVACLKSLLTGMVNAWACLYLFRVCHCYEYYA